MQKTKIITKEQFVEICYNFVKEERQYDEPIPAITEEELNEITYCLEKPLFGWNGKLFFETISKQATALCFCICKKHCFSNGNKRLAIITTILFLIMNGYNLTKCNSLFYLLACGTVITRPEQDELTKEGLEEFFDSFIKPFDISELLTEKLFK